jgi:CDP-diacylglycerol--glycerol-3-phosphate 3-phosphatidyltransferase
MSVVLKMLPNILTGSRLIFAAGFVLLLGLADVEDKGQIAAGEALKLDWAFVLFVIAGLTDIIDGPIARRLKVTSKFGRSFDPFVDKILIAGGFILLAYRGSELTGIAWWMVGVVLAREILVTILRSISESQGHDFRATWAGKLKMFLQSFAIGTVIIYVAHCQNESWALIIRYLAVWIAVVFTALSMLIYLPRLKNIKLKDHN